MAYPETPAVLDFHFAQFGAAGIYADPETEAETSLTVLVDSYQATRPGSPREGHAAEAFWFLRFRSWPLRGLRRNGTVRIVGPADNPYRGYMFKLESPRDEEDVVAPEWVAIRLA